MQTRIHGYGWHHFRGQQYQTASLVSGCAFDGIQQEEHRCLSDASDAKLLGSCAVVFARLCVTVISPCNSAANARWSRLTKRTLADWRRTNTAASALPRNVRSWQASGVLSRRAARQGSFSQYPAVSADNLRPIVEAQIHGATYAMTDEGGAAKKVGSEFTQRGSVNHGAGKCVRGNIRTKTVESYSSIMKRDLLDVSLRQPATFEANLAEFDFR